MLLIPVIVNFISLRALKPTEDIPHTLEQDKQTYHEVVALEDNPNPRFEQPHEPHSRENVYERRRGRTRGCAVSTKEC